MTGDIMSQTGPQNHQQQVKEMQPEYKLIIGQIAATEELPLDWSPLLISATHGVCIYAVGGKVEDKSFMRLASLAKGELEKAGVDMSTFGVKYHAR